MRHVSTFFFPLLLLAPASHALEIMLPNPVTITVVVDKLELLDETDGVAVGTDRSQLTRYSFYKVLSVETNGVRIAGAVGFDAVVTQPTKDIATAEGTGKTYDALTRTKQVATSRAQALAKLRPALVAAKERVEK